MSEIAASLDSARARLKGQSSPDYLTVEEAAELARCHPSTIRRAFAAGELPAFRPAGRVLLRESDVRAWIERRSAVQPNRARHPRPERGRARPGSVQSLREIERRLEEIR